MKFNVILVLKIFNSIKLQGVHFYIIDINYSGNQRVNISQLMRIKVPDYGIRRFSRDSANSPLGLTSFPSSLFTDLRFVFGSP